MDTKWDLAKYPLHMRGDVSLRNDNIDNNKKLCIRCDGTGNELYSAYRKCKDCNGYGVAAPHTL